MAIASHLVAQSIRVTCMSCRLLAEHYCYNAGMLGKSGVLDLASLTELQS